MSKNIATNLFNDKISIYVTECLSTNDILINLLKRNKVVEGDSIETDFQYQGKGQRNNTWISEKESNILLSFLLSPNLKVENQFIIHVLVSISLIKLLNKLNIDARIKWPNDIYVGDKKIAGILIENFIFKKKVQNSVVGIGLNLNQRNFKGFRATSVYLETNIKYEKKEVVDILKNLISFEYNRINKSLIKKIIQYKKLLYGFNEIKKFKIDSKIVKARIIDISVNGDLILNINKKYKKFSYGSLSLLEE